MSRDSESDRVTLQRGPGGGAHDTWVTPRAPSHPPPIGIDAVLSPLVALDAAVDRYRSVERLGVGGMGEVTRVFDAKIGREIAVKTLLSGEPVGQARFLREARVQALLEHPAIVPVYDIHAGADGLPFFTMKRIHGETLQEVVDGHRATNQLAYSSAERNRLLRAFVTVCLAVEYAHQRGILHRDLKPANVMLGTHGEVYVLDWGIAKLLDARSASREVHIEEETEPGDVVGTLGFMAPEQVLGDLVALDARTDVYALGAMLYEIVTLEPLHGRGDPASVVSATLDQRKRSATNRPGVPPELHDLALHATSYRQEDRPVSARVLAEAVEGYLDGDRDEARREKLADARAALAALAMERALTGPADARVTARASAMRDAGQALALVPEHALAADVVLRLLAEPPAEVPPEVVEEIAARDAAFADQAMGDNTFRVLSWFLAVPIVIAMGVEATRFVVGILGWMILTAALSVIAWRTHRSGPPVRLALFAGTTLTFALYSGIFGPFVLVPALAAVNTLLFSAQASRRHRPWLIAIGVLPFIAPLLLELAGLVPPSFDFGGGVITLHPRLVRFPAALTFFFLAVASVLSVVTPTLLTGRLRDALRDAEAKLVLQKWQLGELSPRRRRAG